MKAKTVLVTGASGFIGRTVCSRLLALGYSIRAATSDETKRDALNVFLSEGLARRKHTPSEDRETTDSEAAEQSARAVVIPSPTWNKDAWDQACDQVDVVIHLAGRAHILRDTASDPLSEFRQINRDMSVVLADSAVKAGVARMVFVSSIGVNGNSTAGIPMRETDTPRPHDLYARSKLEAEQALLNISKQTALELVIVRPPLVYGPGARGNFPRLLKLVNLGLPLPLSNVRNKRSLIGVSNLADALVACAFHPAAGGQVFLVCDGDWSTADLIRRIACYMNKPARLFPVPVALLRFTGWLTGQSSVIRRLCDSLEIDASKVRKCLEWTPSLSPEEGLRQAVESYRENEFR